MAMEKEIKVSVIIPVYNTEKYLSQCLDSVFSQTLKEIEIICVDDGSTDTTPEILEKYAGFDKRIQVLHQKNSGSGIARNVGINISKGEYLIFLDADDWYPESDSLEKLYLASKENQALICGGFRKEWNEVLSSERNFDNFEKTGFINYSDYQYDYHYQRFIFNREMIIKNELFFPPYLRYQDPIFFVKAMITAKRFYVIPDVVYCYRAIKKNISKDERKSCDLMRGLIDNLHISDENRLEKLHRITLYRAENDWYECLYAVRNFQSDYSLSLLLSLNNAVDRELIGLEKDYVIKPLRELIYREQEMKEMEKDIAAIMASPSYRIGRAITYLPRKVRDAKKHG